MQGLLVRIRLASWVEKSVLVAAAGSPVLRLERLAIQLASRRRAESCHAAAFKTSFSLL